MCANCTYINEKFNTKYNNCEYVANDNTKWEILKTEIRKRLISLITQ